MEPLSNTGSKKSSWNLRDEVLDLTHRWDVIMAFILLGSLLGWGASQLWPSPYRATRDIYVGLNAYRFADDSLAGSLAGQPFRLVDDYKNWQMEQLNDLILSDIFIQDTLEQLRKEDSYWDDITTVEFLQMASALWRNVGEWHLIIENSESKRATQAVLAWENTIVNRINEALFHAREVVSLDIEMNQLAETRQDLIQREEKLAFVKDQLIFLIGDLRAKPAEVVISSREYTTIMGIVSQAADWQPGWDLFLDKAPIYGSSGTELINWLEGVLSLIEEERKLLPLQISFADEQYTSLSNQYREKAASSFGLSATLVIETDEMTTVEVNRIQPKGTLILVGAALGLLTWIILVFWKIQNRMK